MFETLGNLNHFTFKALVLAFRNRKLYNYHEQKPTRVGRDWIWEPM